MQLLIACAKTMATPPPPTPPGHAPAFLDYAAKIAADMAQYTPEQLQQILRVNHTIATENYRRYKHWGDPDTLRPAVMSYDGIVFQRLDARSLSPDTLRYADAHLFIGSFLYGLLRPLDLINPYRLEGDVTLPVTGFKTLFDYWKPILTDYLIDTIKSDDGILVNLASAEFKRLFDWRRVTKEVTVLTPEFRVVKDGREKMVTVYAKICRGAMTRYILETRPTTPEDLTRFTYEGFLHTDTLRFVLPQ